MLISCEDPEESSFGYLMSDLMLRMATVGKGWEECLVKECDRWKKLGR